MFVFLGSYFPSKKRWRFKVLILKFHCAITTIFKKGQNSKVILRNKIQDIFFNSFIAIVLGGVQHGTHTEATQLSSLYEFQGLDIQVAFTQ